MKLDWRYNWKQIPDCMDVKCPKCGALARFTRTVKDPPAYTRRRHSVCRQYEGKIICVDCGYAKNDSINWPNDAYYQLEYRGLLIWAWNRQYLRVLEYWVSSKFRKEDELPRYVYFLACLPRGIVLAKNRPGILREIRKML